MGDIRRRDFITLLGGAATWPLVAQAQQPAVPVIGMLVGGSPQADAFRVDAVKRNRQEASTWASCGSAAIQLGMS
jgi:putative tryptophan/tyrosine transport system substrate-binding protein